MALMSIILSVCSIVISVITLMNDTKRDKAKMALKVIGNFDNLVLPKLRKISTGKNVKEQVMETYLAVKYIVQLYAYIDSNLANSHLIRKYLHHDLFTVTQNLQFIVKGLSLNQAFKSVTDDYSAIIKKCGLSASNVIQPTLLISKEKQQQIADYIHHMSIKESNEMASNVDDEANQHLTKI